MFDEQRFYDLIQRDFPIVQGVVFTMVVVVIAVNLITDLLCAAVDPRIEQ